MAKKSEIAGISCDIFHARNETEHFHKHIELMFVVSGQLHMVIENNEFLVDKEETVLINSNRIHYLYVEKDTVVCRINVSSEMLEEIFDEEYISFWCNHLTENESGYRELRNYFREIIWLSLKGEKNDGFRILEQEARLLNFLTRNYKQRLVDSGRSEKNAGADQVQEVLHYLNSNYQEPVSLAALADRMFVSVSTLSRLFKKATGVKFPDYVNQLRMHYATEDLLNTNKSITEIAVDNGFSSPSSFNRVFKEIYGITPSQYKKSVRNTPEEGNRQLTAEETTQVQKYLEGYFSNEAEVKETAVIHISAEGGNPFHNISTKTVSLGAFYQLTNSAVQNQIRQMVEQLHLEYIRMWNIFSPKCMIASTPEEKVLSFEQVDAVLDFLVSIHVYPFLDMTDHPECLIQNGRKLFFKKDDSMGFQNLEQWSYFLDQLMSHVVFRYGREEVSHWIFEFGDYNVDSGLDYYSGGHAYYEGNVYKDVFRTAYQIIKSYCQDAMVGGPDWVFDGKALDLLPYFKDWEEMGFYPDFYSIHLFPYTYNKDLEGSSSFYNDRNMDPDFMKNQMYDAHNRLKAAGAPPRPLFVTETTTILSNRNAMNDHCARGTNVLRVTNIFQDYADMVIFWVATDRLSLHYAPSGILHGGSGLMSKDGIPKPSYYALYFLAKLGNTSLGRGPGYVAVRNEPENIYILCYNHKNLIYDYKYEEENVVNVHNVNSMFEDDAPLKLRFLVEDLTADREYVIKRHIVNRENGSVMDEWGRLGFEPKMRNNDIDYMKSICVPRIKMEHRIAENGKLMLDAELMPHEMHLLHIYR